MLGAAELAHNALMACRFFCADSDAVYDAVRLALIVIITLSVWHRVAFAVGFPVPASDAFVICFCE